MRLSEDDLEDLADEWGVDTDLAEAMVRGLDADQLEVWEGPHDAMTAAELDDYLGELAEILDIDIHDLYEMWHGYEP